MKSIFLLVSLFSFNAHPWGDVGHRIVGEIAQRHLKGCARRQVKKLLEKPHSLALESNWADDIKSDPSYNWASPMHYVSIPDGQTYEDHNHPEPNIIKAIREYTAILKNKKEEKAKRTEALKFLTHFVGDIHQPLHVGRVHDRGGNNIKLKWFGENTNLHAVWDSDIILSQHLYFTEYVNFIDIASKKEIKKLQDSNVLDWANESMALRESVYKDVIDEKGELTEWVQQRYWEYGYRFRHRETLNKRLREGGYRLAGLLNEVFCH